MTTRKIELEVVVLNGRVTDSRLRNLYEEGVRFVQIGKVVYKIYVDSDVLVYKRAIEEVKSSRKGAPKEESTKKGAKGTKNGKDGKDKEEKGATMTKEERVNNWCKEKGITDEERIAYGVAIKEVRAEIATEVENSGKRLTKKKWIAEVERRMADRGFTKK